MLMAVRNQLSLNLPKCAHYPHPVPTMHKVTLCAGDRPTSVRALRTVHTTKMCAEERPNSKQNLGSTSPVMLALFDPLILKILAALPL